MKRGWFGPKVFGWGASPASWEGWLATAVFVAAMIGVGLLFEHRSWGWAPPFGILAVYLVVVVLTYRRDARTWF